MYERIKEFFIEELGLNEDDISPESDLRNDIGISSLEFPNLVLSLEETFDIAVDQNEITECQTVQDLTNFVEMKIG